MNATHSHLQRLQLDIERVAKSCDRDPHGVQLLAVSKKQSVEKIKSAYDAGQRAFGENYLQEALEKADHLKTLDISWHFIGSIQSNKTRDISEHFQWVHTVDREKIARRLSDQRPSTMPALNVCVQVNIDNEASKSGATLEDVEAIALAVAAQPNLRLRGLMAIPDKTLSANSPDQPHPFSRLQSLYASLKQHPTLNSMDTLSMGMSDDWQIAIAQGATIIRLGTSVFGKRESP